MLNLAARYEIRANLFSQRLAGNEFVHPGFRKSNQSG
jgi:hypothetical protein